MKKIATIGICLLMVHMAFAQLDEKRMQRDLDISKNILSSLFKESGNRIISSRRMEASYIEGFGIIIKVPANSFAFNYHFDVREPKVIFAEPFNSEDMDVHVFSDEQIRVEIQNQIETIEEDRAELEEEREKLQDERERLEEKREAKEKKKRKSIVQGYSYDVPSPEDPMSMNFEEQNEQTEEVFITFLSDYADLIGQLKPDEKIRIVQESKHEPIAMVWTGQDGEDEFQSFGPSALSVTAEKKNISSLKTGKIDQDEFVKRLEISRDQKEKRAADLDIFGNVFRQYFSPDYSKTFFTDRKPEYEHLENLGVIYSVRTYSSYLENDRYFFPAAGKEKLNEEERKTKIEELYPQFIADLQAFIVDYGRTIRSLSTNEKLMMNIQMTKCESCSIPKFIEVTVPMAQLINYDQQKISRDKAISAVIVKE